MYGAALETGRLVPFCGGGYRTRTRSVAIPEADGGEKCTGLATETEQCNANACAGSKTIKAVPKFINTGSSQ